LNENMTVNAAIVGQSAATIAKLAGFDVPPHAKVLVSEENSTARENQIKRKNGEQRSSLLAV